MSEILELCQKLVQFPSVEGNVESILLFLKECLEKIGFSARLMVFDNGKGKKVANLCASYGSGKPHFLFAGHADVVTAGDLSVWKHSPFEAKIEDSILYGRGIADMKGGIACFIQACKDFIAKEDFSGKITIIVSGDEEDPIVEGTHKILETLHDEGEKFDFALVGEPSNPRTMGDEIKIGRRGDIVLHILSFGQQGHTAYADSLSNPVYNLVNLLYKLQNDKLDEGNAYFAPSLLHITTIDVGNSASNIVPEVARATVDIRFNSLHTYADIEIWVNKNIGCVEGNFDVEYEYIGESFLSSVDENVEKLKKVVAKYAGKEPKYSTSGGTSDARFIKNYCSVVEYGLTNSTIHKVNEHESLLNIEILYNVYKDFLREFFCK